MLASIFLDSSAVTPTLVPPESLATAVKAIIISEGIYDLDRLIESFPEYRQWFIAAAFGTGDTYGSFSILKYPLVHRHLRWLVIHSEGDQLVDLAQSQMMYEYLFNIYGPDADQQVRSNFDDLKAGHNDILKTDDYVRLVTEFVLGKA